MAISADLLDRCRYAQQFLLGAALFASVSPRALADAQRRAHDIAQVIDIERFGNKIERPGLERDNCGFHATVRGDHGTRQLWMFLLYMADEIDAIAIRQAHVGEAQVEFELLEEVVCLLDILRRARLEIHASEGELQELTDVGLVIHDQDLTFAHNDPTANSPHSSARAKVTRKRLPTLLSPGKYSNRAPLLSHSSLAM